MSKLVLFNMVTVDGFFAGPNGEIDWHNVDAQFNDFAIDQLNSADGLLFGRITYELMASYWSTPDALKDDPIVAGKMNSLPKFVYSRTLQKVDWNNTTLVKENVGDQVSKLKRSSGRDLFIFGSADFASTMTQLGLIDEYRILVNPIVLGNGQPLFKGAMDRIPLKLASTRTFDSGNVLLVYRPAGK